MCFRIALDPRKAQSVAVLVAPTCHASCDFSQLWKKRRNSKSIAGERDGERERERERASVGAQHTNGGIWHLGKNPVLNVVCIQLAVVKHESAGTLRIEQNGWQRLQIHLPTVLRCSDKGGRCEQEKAECTHSHDGILP